ncbi:hypothetical protein RRG08_050264 [Elysia crispata]|uniref:Uncharacterized protein n=1 Tax=Elysia crispata TaxID=231223 RepID=A0AAE1E9X7_9GAST|nr:hypothetical protein RRG08_050264 [Elysia crispata]
MSGEGDDKGPRREEEVVDTEETLPDGTVHHVHKVHRHTVKVTQKAVDTEDGQKRVVEVKEDVPGSCSDEIVETFQEPPRMEHDEEVVDEVRPDGSHVTHKLLLNRMVTHTHTHQESFDEGDGGSRKIEDFDTDEWMLTPPRAQETPVKFIDCLLHEVHESEAMTADGCFLDHLVSNL